MGTTAIKKWVLDPAHSELVFKVRHLMISNVKGEFRKFTAVIEGEELENSTVHVSVEAGSIYTNEESRDNHLKSADFFDVANHNEISFKSNSLRKVDNENFKLTGKLVIKGISKEIVLDVEFGGIKKDPWGNEKAGFSFNGKINRKDWGLNWNAALESGGVMVSEEVKVSGELEFVKQA